VFAISSVHYRVVCQIVCDLIHLFILGMRDVTDPAWDMLVALTVNVVMITYIARALINMLLLIRNS
jgi:hypothetical protein